MAREWVWVAVGVGVESSVASSLESSDVLVGVEFCVSSSVGVLVERLVGVGVVPLSLDADAESADAPYAPPRRRAVAAATMVAVRLVVIFMT
ncbi:MAG: hypothetical protein M3P23_10945 [Actinomycetota bacterium]|nr:hypothetical protein [Actinomycetota bacterium]